MYTRRKGIPLTMFASPSCDVCFVAGADIVSYDSLVVITSNISRK